MEIIEDMVHVVGICAGTLLGAVGSVTGSPPTSASLIQRLQPVIDAVSNQHNVSFSVGVRSENTGTVTVFAGQDDRSSGKVTHVTEETGFAMGSVTKVGVVAKLQCPS